jgi:hypothetical protein
MFPDISTRNEINWKIHLEKQEEGSVSPYFPSVMLGGENPNVILIKNVAFKSF